MNKIVFLSDYFIDDYLGGAELTQDALIKAKPDECEIVEIPTQYLTLKEIEEHKDAYWVICNFAELHPSMLTDIIKAGIRYSIIEFDYKFCASRSEEYHEYMTGKPCDCKRQEVIVLFEGADVVFFMSDEQKLWYMSKIPDIRRPIVLGSVFSEETLNMIKSLAEQSKGLSRSGWIVIHSNSWVKGTRETVKYCVANGIDYKLLEDRTYELMLHDFSKAEGYVYLPQGKDTCPRAVIEAKLLGCKLIINDNVQHQREEWFDTNDTNKIFEHLRTRTTVFWGTLCNCIG